MIPELLVCIVGRYAYVMLSAVLFAVTSESGGTVEDEAALE